MVPKVLLVDDDDGLRGLLAAALRRHAERFQVLTAGNGREAIEILEREQISLVVTDLMMPVMDGFKLLTEIGEKHPEVSRIVMSSSQSGVMRAHQELRGFDAFLVKPVSSKMVEEKIFKALEDRKPTGYLKGISLVSFVQLLDIEQKTCTLQVHHLSSDRHAEFYFRRGRLLDARLGDRRGMDLACEILAWSDVHISIDDECPDVADSIRMPLSLFLLEAVFRRDMQQSGLPLPERGGEVCTSLSQEESEANEPPVAEPVSAPKEVASAPVAEVAPPVAELPSPVEASVEPPPDSVPPATPRPVVRRSLREMLASELVDLPEEHAPVTHGSKAPVPPPAPEVENRRAGPVDKMDLRNQTVEFDSSRLERFFASGEPPTAPAPAVPAHPTVSRGEPRAEVRREAGHAEFGQLFQDGFEAFRRADYREALALWERAAALKPGDGRLQHNLKLAAKKLAAQPKASE